MKKKKQPNKLNNKKKKTDKSFIYYNFVFRALITAVENKEILPWISN